MEIDRGPLIYHQMEDLPNTVPTLCILSSTLSTYSLDLYKQACSKLFDLEGSVSSSSTSKMFVAITSSSSSSFIQSSSLFSFSSSSTKTPVSKRDIINLAFLLPKNSKLSSHFSIQKCEPFLGFPTGRSYPVAERGRFSSICFSTAKDESGKETGLGWPILNRWDVPWSWQRASLTMVACGLSFALTGLVESAVVPYLGLQISELSLDEKAEIIFVDQTIATAVVLGVLYGLTNAFQPLPNDIFRYELKEPFNLQNGWLLWAGLGLVGALGAIALTGAVMALFSSENPQRETDALVRLLPLIGSSGISTACLVGITGFLAPLLEETVFRGFLMVFLTKWFPTPVSVLLTAAVFALAHLTPGEFPQLFVLGTVLGFSYAQTRNLLTPITIHAIWNSGVILLLTFLQLQGYDIRELLQAS